MSYKKTRYSSNNHNWLFFHPTVGDNWSHLVEQECWKDSDNYYETEERELEKKPQKESKLTEKLILLGMAFSLLLGGMAILFQIPNLQKSNINLSEKLR